MLYSWGGEVPLPLASVYFLPEALCWVKACFSDVSVVIEALCGSAPPKEYFFLNAKPAAIEFLYF